MEWLKTVNWDEVIKWSGWFIVIGFTIWEIIKYVRNRYNVSIKVSLESDHRGGKENLVVIEASNDGRRPVKLTLAGIYFKKETIVQSDKMDIKIGWVYKKIPHYSFIKLKLLKDLIKSLPPTPGDVKADGICFLDESGDKHIGYFPDKLRQVLYS